MISMVLHTGEIFNYTPGNASAPYEFSLLPETENTLSKQVRDFIYDLLNTPQSNSMSLIRESEIKSMIENGNHGEYIAGAGSSGRKDILNTRMYIRSNIIIC